MTPEPTLTTLFPRAVAPLRCAELRDRATGRACVRAWLALDAARRTPVATGALEAVVLLGLFAWAQLLLHAGALTAAPLAYAAVSRVATERTIAAAALAILVAKVATHALSRPFPRARALSAAVAAAYFAAVAATLGYDAPDLPSVWLHGALSLVAVTVCALRSLRD